MRGEVSHILQCLPHKHWNSKESESKQREKLLDDADRLVFERGIRHELFILVAEAYLPEEESYHDQEGGDIASREQS